MPQPDVEWDVFQSLGRMPENLDSNLPADNKTWYAVAIDKTTREIVVESDPQTSDTAARADGDRKLAAWKKQDGAA